MKNYISAGNLLPFTAAATIASGALVIVGDFAGVATGDVANGAQGTLNLEGVYDLPKAPSQAWTQGALIYWDTANARATNVASGNTLIGRAWAAVAGGAGDVIGRVRLKG